MMKKYELLLLLLLNTCFLIGQTQPEVPDLKSELSEKMLFQKAPDFVMQNLEGENISLESLKGKVVVLDFWATWCPPCKASFPMMQKATNKFKNEEDVVFYFVNTREKVENKVETVKSFLIEKGYDFEVLFDFDKSVYNKYQMRGIPTKFVIDPLGNIRFKSVGYRPGDDDELLEELSEMIELSKEIQ